MSSDILDMIDKTAVLYPNNVAVGDINADINYAEFIYRVKSVATAIINKRLNGKPIAILMKRSRFLPIAMISVLYSGNFYVVLDSESPVDRLKKIINTLQPSAVIYEEDTHNLLSNINIDIEKLKFNDIIDEQHNEELLKATRKNALDCDPAFSIFTSGSTGQPKGTLITHRNLKSYISWFTSCFNIDENTIFGSQTPMYFSMSVSDMYGAFVSGGAYQVIPKEYFAFPAKLVDFMNSKKVNTIYWVPSAYGLASKFNLFKYCKPQFLNKALFAGEVMPVKYLNYWKSYFPEILYANLFGPTETTDICSYYIVNREFEDSESLPIGIACDNCRLFIVGDDGNEVSDGEKGELYVLGESVASGYYNNKEKTDEVFVQNILNKAFPQTVYKTGDIVRKNKFGELEYIGRKDFQIKHMGYRIELGEIEVELNCAPSVEIAVCIYDETKDKLLIAYEGTESAKKSLVERANDKLPIYMVPNEYFKFEKLPQNMNGKIDRKEIKKIILKSDAEK